MASRVPLGYALLSRPVEPQSACTLCSSVLPSCTWLMFYVGSKNEKPSRNHAEFHVCRRDSVGENDKRASQNIKMKSSAGSYKPYNSRLSSGDRPFVPGLSSTPFPSTACSDPPEGRWRDPHDEFDVLEIYTSCTHHTASLRNCLRRPSSGQAKPEELLRRTPAHRRLSPAAHGTLGERKVPRESAMAEQSGAAKERRVERRGAGGRRPSSKYINSRPSAICCRRTTTRAASTPTATPAKACGTQAAKSRN